MDASTEIHAPPGPQRLGPGHGLAVLVVGLGPIGAGVGAALAERGECVFGIDPDAERTSAWASQTGMPVAGRLGDGPDREDVDVVIVAVRLATQLWDVLDALPVGEGPVFVLSTLGLTDARALGSSPHDIVEAPVSGGPHGARDGTLTMFLHARGSLRPAAQRVVEDITSEVFTFDAYGLPAVAKLTNNTLAAYHALAVAGMAEVASEAGLDRATFMAVVAASSGQSWMGDHFTEFAQDLLFKDVELLQQDVHDLPVIHMTGIREREAEIDSARRRMRSPAVEYPLAVT
ncbi:NAD(P)-binding domain-containing protein [Pseudonocardia sp. CA-107938]|uniref:NAD(P)-binding domain-containing protein n=1 Tax=Pseudonocardia sp. CA-107938 TaxID=3240021 RepID=UPI003D8B7A45